MTDVEQAVARLGDMLVYEIVNAAGLPKRAGWFRLFRLFFRQPTRRLAAVGLGVDQRIASQGVVAATAWALTHYCREVQARGRESLPASGPLLVVANHAGTFDSFVICSQLGRPDFKVISSDIPFFKNLPHIREHAIFLTDRTPDRSAAARAGIRHLKQGGALLVFGTGLIDPDPAVYPGAAAHLERWSPSLELFLRTVPEARLVTAIVSGMVSKRWAHHPVTRLRRIDWQKRRIAEFSQVIYQLFLPGRLYLEPRLSFSPPVTRPELSREAGGEQVLPAAIARARRLLEDHCLAFPGCRT